jgi:molybdate transport system substrate-binding protein
MTIRSIAAAIAAFNLGCMLLFAQGNAAKTGDVRVLSSNGIKAVVDDVHAQAERAAGHPLAIDFSTGASLKKRIEGGEAFDVAILQPEALDDLAKQGKITAGPHPAFARSGIGIGARAGAPKPDIATSEAAKKTFLKAKSITYTRDGASRAAIDKMFEGMGIMNDLKPKIKLTEAGQAPEVVAKGEAEYVITLISEILPIHGVELVGPLPSEYQSYVSFGAGVGAHAANPEAANALVKFLTGPSVAPKLKTKGMESPLTK